VGYFSFIGDDQDSAVYHGVYYILSSTNKKNKTTSLPQAYFGKNGRLDIFLQSVFHSGILKDMWSNRTM
jgi:hypothetical protein